MWIGLAVFLFFFLWSLLRASARAERHAESFRAATAAFAIEPHRDLRKEEDELEIGIAMWRPGMGNSAPEQRPHVQ